jgi:hypothetical protein
MPVLGISDYLNQLYIVQFPCLDLIKGYFQFEIRLSTSDFTYVIGHRSSVTHISHLPSLFAIEDLTLIFVAV